MQQMQDASGKTPLVQSWLKTVWWFAGSYRSQKGDCTYLSAGNQSSNGPWKSLISTDTNIILWAWEQSVRAEFGASAPFTPTPISAPLNFGGWFIFTGACAPDTTRCTDRVSRLSRSKQQFWFLSILAAKDDRSNFKVAMPLINAGQEHAQGITKHVLGSPKKHMESKARGCSLSSPRNTTMLQPQKVYIN